VLTLPLQEWPKIVDQMDILFRKLVNHLPTVSTDMTILIQLMATLLKLPVVTTAKVGSAPDLN